MRFLKNEVKELFLFLVFAISFYLFFYVIGTMFLYIEYSFTALFYSIDIQTAIDMINYKFKQRAKVISLDYYYYFFFLKPSILFELYFSYRIINYIYTKYQQWRNKKESLTLEIQTISKKDRLIFELKIVIDFILCFIVFNIFFKLIMQWLTPNHLDEFEALPMLGVLILFVVPFALYISYRISKIIRNKTWRRILNHG
ncbi:conserved hypothetical protein [Aliarcobacter butzleri JV22]|uniref:hypothetical protein n=1 Tax=Aliarcobacter butzleri TaxID=28197 RepID=UPI0001F12D93|nr:hypothetical protein [Aliarcobacter butzleri]EFU69382.1 conserved hypothetical protein [Aliarcobacter butzleri JV22]